MENLGVKKESIIESVNFVSRKESSWNDFAGQGKMEKILDEKEMIAKLWRNQVIQKFCTNDLKEDKSFSQNTILLMSNFSFLIKLSIVHLIFICLPFTPRFGMILMLVVEISYLFQNVRQYIRKRHLKSLIMLIPRVVQSLALIFLQFTILITYTQLENLKMPLGQGTQKLLVNFILYCTYFEYLILAVNVAYIVYSLRTEMKKKKSDPAYKNYLENRD